MFIKTLTYTVKTSLEQLFPLNDSVWELWFKKNNAHLLIVTTYDCYKTYYFFLPQKNPTPFQNDTSCNCIVGVTATSRRAIVHFLHGSSTRDIPVEQSVSLMPRSTSVPPYSRCCRAAALDPKLYPSPLRESKHEMRPYATSLGPDISYAAARLDYKTVSTVQ